jgi:hypothetical protein
VLVTMLMDLMTSSGSHLSGCIRLLPLSKLSVILTTVGFWGSQSPGAEADGLDDLLGQSLVWILWSPCAEHSCRDTDGCWVVGFGYVVIRWPGIVLFETCPGLTGGSGWLAAGCWFPHRCVGFWGLFEKGWRLLTALAVTSTVLISVGFVG